MSEGLEALRRKIEGASELNSVVRTMKALAASGITQYEHAVQALEDYCKTVELGLSACLRDQRPPLHAKGRNLCAIIFGSDQGLVGQYNEILADFALKNLQATAGEKIILSVGERMQAQLCDTPLIPQKTFTVPAAIPAITKLVATLLTEIEHTDGEVLLFHNKPASGAGYQPVVQRLLPLDDTWQNQFQGWPTKMPPESLNSGALQALIREYLFIFIYRACAEALASENASRLAAMQRAEKNIAEMLEDLGQRYNRQRQNSIDEELFDVISGFEALTDK